MLEQIECAPTGVIFHVKSGDRALRLRTARLDTVAFVSFRPDLTGNVTCGAPSAG